MMGLEYFSDHGYWLTRMCFQRALALIYVIGFVNILNQWSALLGSHGLTPANEIARSRGFFENPTIFYFNASDCLFTTMAWAGLILSIIALLGLSENFGYGVSMATWFLLWAIYLSFVNVGRVWYSFGWETMLLEVGFLAVFLGPRNVEPSLIVLWLLRWVLFRNMFGAGMIKIRGDICWRDLTCLYYYYETQPMPNPLSLYFHHLPKFIHRGGVLFNHFAELIVPFFYFAPSTLALIAGVITIVFQLGIIVSGNLSFLNYLTIVMAIPCLNDGLLSKLLFLSKPATLLKIPQVPSIITYVLLGVIVILSYRPARNLLSSSQLMNSSFDRFHLVNTYGAFGSITRERYEIVIEGTLDETISEKTKWREYEFKGKPGDVEKTPHLVAPYHLRLDWLMWFAAMNSYHFHPWILELAAHLLRADEKVLRLLEQDPFDGARPKYLRMSHYLYEFERVGARAVWKREYVRSYLPPIFLDKQGRLVAAPH